MTKTFEELLLGHCKNVSNIKNIVNITSVSKEIVLNLMSQVRQATLQEAADKADADFNLMGLNKNDINATVEVYVLKHSILDLDKNSIEL